MHIGDVIYNALTNEAVVGILIGLILALVISFITSLINTRYYYKLNRKEAIYMFKLDILAKTLDKLFVTAALLQKHINILHEAREKHGSDQEAVEKYCDAKYEEIREKSERVAEDLSVALGMFGGYQTLFSPPTNKAIRQVLQRLADKTACIIKPSEGAEDDTMRDCYDLINQVISFIVRSEL